MEDKLKNFRQPLITSTGILLGFVLNIASGWVSNPTKRQDYHSLIAVTCLLICILLFVTVLYRALNMNYPPEKVEAYHKKTLFCFIAGILIIFANILFVMIQNYFVGS